MQSIQSVLASLQTWSVCSGGLHSKYIMGNVTWTYLTCACIVDICPGLLDIEYLELLIGELNPFKLMPGPAAN